MPSSNLQNRFALGDWIVAYLPKNKRSLFRLSSGAVFNCFAGSVSHQELVGLCDGSVLKPKSPIFFTRASLADYTVNMRRRAAVIYPKDCAQILALADIGPDSWVAEAGVGSGALSLWILRALGPGGRLLSFETNPEHAARAQKNILGWNPNPLNWSLVIADVEQGLLDAVKAGSLDCVVYDLLSPWAALPAARTALRPGGNLVAYATGALQASRLVESIRRTGWFFEPVVLELLQRLWHVHNLAVRPVHGVGRHTGFLISARKLAEFGSVPPARVSASKLALDPRDCPVWSADQLGES